ncbi:DNA repair protein RecN [Thermosulfurimonas sp. F29]|uniref:DNA repair protein RecN n=1 Tax=Thermosulfurimonas sp. F29 TaxID=2867247 RepID=UPI001C83D898|nr:DNA repair protein RecN [Thermosulfurimonas sp. F29]MBX6422491.1 DNA repair protein RecN [Thermosulfurimonas sp. F29]
MLAELRLKNLLLIEEASLSFAPGFTVFTGETGAGKSLLVKALRLVLGERGSPDYVRPGAREAVVEAFLVSPELPERLSALGFDPAEEVLIRRVLAPERSRAFVNGTPVPLRMLSELTRGLVILTGQHEFRALLSPEYRLRVLDTFAGLEEQRKAYADLYRKWRGVHEERTRLEGELLRAARERDFLEFQIREIEEADLSPGEDEALLREREILRNLTRLKTGLFEGSRALEEASEALSRALSSLRDLSRIEGELAPLLARLEEVYYELLEASRELSGRLADLPEDDARLEEVEARLSRIENLKRKYGATVEEILSTLEELRRRREGLEVGEERLGELRSREKELAERVLSSALEISSARHSAARRLSRAMNRELEALALSGAEFRVEVETPAARPENLTPFGLDRVRFLVRTNPGTPARPLEKVVSGGELSRIFLALKSLLAERDRAACLVFDEVDAGIGGMVAVRVGEKLKELARREQVLCITHLPQIARLADHHFAVEKEVVDGLTYTRVRVLGPEERERELRRMMGEADG